MTRFQNNIAVMDWSDYYSGNANEAFNNFYGIIIDIFPCSLPTFKPKAQPMARKSWITDDVLSMISDKNKLHQKYKQKPTTINRDIYQAGVISYQMSYEEPSDAILLLSIAEQPPRSMTRHQSNAMPRHFKQEC